MAKQAKSRPARRAAEPEVPRVAPMGNPGLRVAATRYNLTLLKKILQHDYKAGMVMIDVWLGMIDGGPENH